MTQVEKKLRNRGWTVKKLKDGTVKLTAKGYKPIKATSLTAAYVAQRD